MITIPCLKCQQVLPLERFHKNRCKSRHNRHSLCKACSLERERKDPRSREKKRRWARLRKYPEREHARRLMRDAVKAGKLTKPKSCSVCGCEPKRVDGYSGIQGHHHKGYSFPLDVVWLCAQCHRNADQARRGK